MDTTQPTQQATQATQRYLIEHFSQEKIDSNIVCRIICTNGTIPIHDLRIDVAQVLDTETPIKKVWTFGRNPASDYFLGNVARYSNNHFQIILGEDANLLLRDTSTNGTWLNGRRVERECNQLLGQGDEISVGVGVGADTLSLVVFINEQFRTGLERLKLERQEEIDGRDGREEEEEGKERDKDEEGNNSSSSPSGNRTNRHDHHNHNHVKHSVGIRHTTPAFKTPIINQITRDFSIQDEVVGSGAFAMVKKAVERKTGKTYAVKIVNKRKVIGNLDGVTRELEVLQKLDHPRIVRLKGFYEDVDNYYMVMEFVSGGDLMDFVAAHGAIGEDAAREITRQILEAIKYIHSLGISHRDLKPDNILIGQDDPVLIKITDFGLAKIQENGTFLSTFCGTLAYVAPEVIGERGSGNGNGPSPSPSCGNSHRERNTYSALVDMWSLGCLVYVILTGHLPFSGATEEELYTQIKHGSYHEKPLREFKVSDNARSFIDALLQVDPRMRLTAGEALNHPWIKMGLESLIEDEQGNYCSQISLAESMSQQQRSLVNNSQRGDARYDFMKLQQMNQNQQQQPINGNGNRDGKKTKEKNKRETTPHGSTFLRLVPLPESNIQQEINISQGINPFLIGRSDHCNLKIEDSRFSRLHCFILKRRHVISEANYYSIYESPAQGLDDVWYCHSGGNPGYVNDCVVGQAQKVLLRDGDEIKVLWDKTDGTVVVFRVEFMDTTGLFIGAVADSRSGGHSVGPVVVEKQSADERAIAREILRLGQGQGGKTNGSRAKTENAASGRSGAIGLQIMSPVRIRPSQGRRSVSGDNDATRIKRVKLDQQP